MHPQPRIEEETIIDLVAAMVVVLTWQFNYLQLATIVMDRREVEAPLISTMEDLDLVARVSLILPGSTRETVDPSCILVSLPSASLRDVSRRCS